MTLLLAMLLSQPSLAVTKNVTICVKIFTHFTDRGGDFWPLNAPRRARGVRYTLNDDNGIRAGYMDDDGCKVISVTSTDTYAVTLYSEAEVNGVELVSYEDLGDASNGSDPVLETHTAPSVPIALNDPEIVINSNQVWWNLAVGMFALDRSDFNMGTHSQRDCCDNTSHNWYNLDGTCTYDSGEYPYADTGFDHYGGPRIEYGWDDDMRIEFVYDDDVGCCGSDWPTWESSNPTESDWPNRPTVHINKPWKFSIAHELGHVIVMKRMGKRTNDDFTADVRQGFLVSPDDTPCSGMFHPAGFDPSSPYDSLGDEGGVVKKNLLSMEFQSGAAREGWAHFFAAWLWNYSGTVNSDCFFDSRKIHDFDLDGDVDNNYGDTGVCYDDDPWDGAFNCEGTTPPSDATHSPVPVADALESYVYDRDWLEDMYTATACDVDDISNRGTQYDWMRYFWDMRTDSEVPIEDLTDIYVDTCPTTWAKNDAQISASEETPVGRLEASTTFHGYEDEHDDQKNNGVDH